MTARLLIVDDSRAMRAYVRGSLRGFVDCEIDEASSGFEALRLLPRTDYKVVITDINMPDINGLELIKFIRASERHRDVPIIIISTHSSKQDQEKALELGASVFLPKPFTPPDIVDVVASLIKEKGGES